MSNILFHTGSLYISGKGKTPRRIMTIQETNFEFKGELTKLMGEKQFAVDTAVGSIDITAKAKNGQLDPEVFNSLFFGQTVQGNAKVLVENETAFVKEGKCLVRAGNRFAENLGVRDLDSGQVLTLTSSAIPEDGQYTVNQMSGEYTFAPSLEGIKISIDYLINDAEGNSLIITSKLAGTTVNFRGIFAKTYRDGRKLTMICRHCVCDSLQFGFKQNDYTLPDFSFALNAGDDDIPFEWHWTTVAS